MGGCSYDRDVYSGSSYSSWGAGSVSDRVLSSKTLDGSMLPGGKKLISKTKNPIIVVLDVTGSNINFARLVYDKFPMFYGQLEQKGYLDDFDISICAVGDAYCDDYPIQVADFAKGIEIDSWLEKLVLESGGGAQWHESYELMAYYLLKNTEFEKNANPYLFFIADEAPYGCVDKLQAKSIGLPIPESEEYNPFKELNEKFKDNVYVMLNKYGGAYHTNITDVWKDIMPPQHVIKIPEEKAIIDLILGVIAVQKKELEIYALDMKNRGQTVERITGVTSSLKELSESQALVRREEIELDIPMQLKLKKNPGTRL